MKKILVFLFLVAASSALDAAPQITLPSIAQMQALGASSAAYGSVYVSSYNSGSGVGGGIFVWNGTSVTAGNSCTVFQATGVTTGRWIRQIADGKLDPTMCGAAGNGSTDDLTAITSFMSVLNSGSYIGTGLNRTYLVTYSNLVFSKSSGSLENITLLGKPGTNVVGAWFEVIAPNASLTNVVIDGNMPNMTSSGDGATYCLLADETASYQNWNNITVRNCNSQDAVLFGIGGGPTFAVNTGQNVSGLNIYGNSGNGIEWQGTTYSTFTNIQSYNNGAGYKKSCAQPINCSTPLGTNAAFGGAFRFNAHDISVSNSLFNYTGRDGLNFNQGSHNITVSNTQANFNGDGGFTFAADNTAPGFPGNSTAPWNIRLVNDMGQGNYTGGVSAYVAVAGLSVIGGAYWNNSRVEGDQVATSSYITNVYIASGSQDAYLKTSAYDDRQMVGVTSSGSGTSSCVFSVSSWTPGMYKFYPKVAFYNASGVFEGYGQISAESSSSLTVSTLPNNSFACGSVASGWFVTQRVSHNGAWIDNGGTGQMDISGDGFLVGPSAAISGKVMLGGGFNTGQNISVANKDADTIVQLLSNPTADANATGYTPTGPTISYVTLGCESPGCVSITGSSGPVVFSNIANSDEYFTADQWVCARVNYYQTTPSDLTMGFQWTIGGNTYNSLAVRPLTVNKWETAKSCGWLPAGSTSVEEYVYFYGSGTVLIDQNSFQIEYPNVSNSGVPVTLPEQIAP